MWPRRVIFALVLVASAVQSSRAADFPPAAATASNPPTFVAALEPLAHSVFLFAGRLSTSDIWSTLIFNLNDRGGSAPNYDNYIVGAAYGLEIWRPGYGFVIGIEVGIADRFGRYETCCLPITKSDGLIHSVEAWGGVSFGHSGIVIGGLYFKPMVVVGLSAINRAIGAERQNEAERNNSSARLLFYLGPELAVSPVAFPNLELVARLHHRSGFYGTLGELMEGYNATVLGMRYRF